MESNKNSIQLTYLLVFVIMILSCNTESREENSKVSEPSVVVERKSETVLSEETVLLKEDFITFFEDFKADSVFQLSRINFPISYYLIDIDDNKEEYVYTRNDFSYIDFTKDDTAYKNETDAYKPVIEEISSKEVLYIRKGIDNGIRIKYYFKQNDKEEWYMTKVIDSSS